MGGNTPRTTFWGVSVRKSYGYMYGERNTSNLAVSGMRTSVRPGGRPAKRHSLSLPPPSIYKSLAHFKHSQPVGTHETLFNSRASTLSGAVALQFTGVSWRLRLRALRRRGIGWTGQISESARKAYIQTAGNEGYGVKEQDALLRAPKSHCLRRIMAHLARCGPSTSSGASEYRLVSPIMSCVR
jgi:hypothetical protein